MMQSGASPFDDRRIVRLADPDDLRLAPYRLIRERDLVGREGRFIAEGKVVLRVLFASSRLEPESALILESRLEGIAEVLAAAPAHMPVYVVPQPVMDRVAGFHVHRGILALGRRDGVVAAADLLAALPAGALVLVLVGVSNHDNVGSIFRNAAAFGADAVFLDSTCCDPLYRKAIRVSVGAALKVPFARFDDPLALCAALEAAGFAQFALTPAGGRDIARMDARAPRTALFLGSEGEGLPASLLQRVSALRIDMAGDFDSLNVAAASAIALHRFWRGPSAAGA